MQAKLAAIAILTGLAMTAWAAPASAQVLSCANKAGALGVSRVIEIDVSGGPMFGTITKRKTETSFLKPKEIVLTFDDGPAPRITGPILRTLDRYCTKATFFAVGRMALAYPQMVKQILKRGHTLASHTWSHPLHLNRMSPRSARAQIEKGFSAISMAAGQPIAPFFRFPGLNDSRALLSYLQKRKVGSFTVDVVSDDSFISDPEELARVTIQRVVQKNRGILLFHDIKPSTAKALPHILKVLKAKGFKIVHLKSKNTYKQLRKYDAKLAPILAKTMQRIKAHRTNRSGAQRTASVKPLLIPFYGTLGPGKYAKMKYLGPPVTQLAPPARVRIKKPVKSKNKREKQAHAKHKDLFARSGSDLASGRPWATLHDAPRSQQR